MKDRVSSTKPLAPEIIERAWKEYGDRRGIVASENISANVSTNSVYRLVLSDGHEVIAKTTVYGSYVYFRQDHRIVQQWIRRLADSRYRNFLARICEQEGGNIFTTHIGDTGVVFYEKTKFYDFLPKVLNLNQVKALGREMGEFHLATTKVAPLLSKSWKSLGSDVAAFYDTLGSPSWKNEHGLEPGVEDALRTQCDQFLTNAENLGYHQFKKIPVLVDWNIGNFSVGMDGDGFKFFSRWDYDWLRVEPRMMDFYFCARVVRAEGDQDSFSYTLDPFFEPRFIEFLREYHRSFPLEEEEVLFVKEAYRVFLLNYVMRIGEHFFRPEYCRRLQREAIDTYFPALEKTDFRPLLRALRS